MPPCSDQSRPGHAGGREDADSLDRPCARRLRDLAVGAEECSRRGSNQRMDASSANAMPRSGLDVGGSCRVPSPSWSDQSTATGSRCDRKIKPVTLRQNPTAADTPKAVELVLHDV